MRGGLHDLFVHTRGVGQETVGEVSRRSDFSQFKGLVDTQKSFSTKNCYEFFICNDMWGNQLFLEASNVDGKKEFLSGESNRDVAADSRIR